MAHPAPVLLMVRTLGPGGTERQVTEIAKSLDRDRFQAHVGCYEDDGFRASELREAGVPILKMRMRSFLSADPFRVLFALRSYLREHRIELVHTFDWPMNLFCVPVAKLLRVPVVLSSQRSYRELIPPAYVPAMRIGDRMADGIVVNCEAIRKHLREDFSIPDEKIATCYNAIDTTLFYPAERERPAALRACGLLIGCVCVLRAIKGLDTLVAAFAQVLPLHPTSRLVIVGDGPEKEILRRQAADLGVEGQVHFYPATHDVAAWFHALDIFVLPSRSEALSNSLMEAMASGCCAVASLVGGNPELVADGENGLIFKPGDSVDLADKLCRVMDDDALRRRLAAAGAARITREFSTATSVAAMERVYQRKLDDKPISKG